MQNKKVVAFIELPKKTLILKIGIYISKKDLRATACPKKAMKYGEITIK
jgi:hypothetical protein